MKNETQRDDAIHQCDESDEQRATQHNRKRRKRRHAMLRRAHQVVCVASTESLRGTNAESTFDVAKSGGALANSDDCRRCSTAYGGHNGT
jgi:hypothetical protein